MGHPADRRGAGLLRRGFSQDCHAKKRLFHGVEIRRILGTTAGREKIVPALGDDGGALGAVALFPVQPVEHEAILASPMPACTDVAVPHARRACASQEIVSGYDATLLEVLSEHYDPVGLTALAGYSKHPLISTVCPLDCSCDLRCGLKEGWKFKRDAKVVVRIRLTGEASFLRGLRCRAGSRNQEQCKDNFAGSEHSQIIPAISPRRRGRRPGLRRGIRWVLVRGGCWRGW
jgi:hypothetical protein